MNGPRTNGSRRSRRTTLVVALLAGLAGMAAYAFHYAEGSSYLSTDPRACTNCHIMQSQFDSWQKASHHTAATCVDCHLPAEFPEKYFAKAKNGWNHSKAFTLQNFHEPIRITEPNAEILQDNCLRCHGGITSDMVAGATTHADAVRCVHCHRTVGHGEPVGLGGPFDRTEIPEEDE